MATRYGKTKFQFLMVQLKGTPFIRIYKGIRFQFLMVQLKVEVDYRLMTYIMFQFLMVQLKASIRISISWNQCRFNS